MKKLFIIVLLFIECGYAQQKNLLYVSGSLEIGNHLGLDIGVTFINKNKYSFSVGGLGMLYGSDNYPDDKDDTDSFPFYGIDDAGHLYFSVGKLIVINNSKTSRLNLSLGFAKTSGYRRYNYIRGEKSDHGYNYSYDFENYRNYSVIINPKFEFVRYDFSGLFISPKIILNSKKSFYGIGLGLMLGKVR